MKVSELASHPKFAGVSDRAQHDALAVVVLAACATWESIVEENQRKGLATKAATVRADGGDTVKEARKVASAMLLERGWPRGDIDAAVNEHLTAVADPLEQEAKLRAVDARRAHRVSPDVLSSVPPRVHVLSSVPPRVHRKAATGDRMLYKSGSGSVFPDVVKAVMGDLVMGVVADVAATVAKKVIADQVKSISDTYARAYGEFLGDRVVLDSRIAEVERLCAPPGPVRFADPRRSRAAGRTAEIARLRKIADELNDPFTREGYLVKVAALEAEAESVIGARALLDREAG